MQIQRTESILSILNNADVALPEREKVLSIATARAIGYKLPIPAVPVENPYQYFSDTLAGQVDKAVCQINEANVVNVDSILSLIRGIWLFRYKLVHDPANPTVSQFFDAMIRVGIDEVPAEMSETIVSEDRAKLVDLVAGRLRASITDEE